MNFMDDDWPESASQPRKRILCSGCQKIGAVAYSEIAVAGLALAQGWFIELPDAALPKRFTLEPFLSGEILCPKCHTNQNAV